MDYSANGEPSQRFYESMLDFTKEWNNSGYTEEAPYFVPFDFGGPAEFTAPKSIESTIHPDLTSYLLQPPGGYLAVICGGRVWGNSGAILSPEGKLIFDLSQEYDSEQHRMLEAEEHPIFHQWNDPELQHLKGTTAALTFCGSHNYFHWMYDVIPRLAILYSSGIAYSSIIMNPNPYGPFVEETWAMLGIAEELVIRTNPKTYFQAEQLIVPSVMMNSHYPPWATNTLRKFLLPHRDTTLISPERIYISRSKARTRRVYNEEDVLHCLREFSIEPIYLEEWTVAEQIQIFATAKVIVSPHGAGLANLAFCEPGTRFIEIFHAQHIVPTYWMISNHNNLDYYMLYARGKPDPSIHFTGLEDICVDIDRLNQTLKLAGLNK